MKTKSILCTLSAVVATLIVSGCSTNRQPVASTSKPPAAPATTAAAGARIQWTLETEVPSDQTQRRADMQKHMQEFAEKGWSVLSVTTHVRPADGTSFRRWELSRAAE